MRAILHKLWRQDAGVLTFEWVLLLTVLVIGIVAGLAGTRDAIIDELGDVAEAVVSIDQSYTLAPDPIFGTPGFGFTDTKPDVTRCDRTNFRPDGN
jgi:hypothetical protein